MRVLPRKRSTFAVRRTGLLLGALACAAAADGTLPPGRYALTAQTVMPHLEEMRRITEHETRCLDGEPGRLFPVLDQPALRGCTLQTEGSPSDRYELVCQTTLVATGRARIVVGTRRVKGDLSVKMGGKNMTFSQHVTAEPQGPCDADR